MPETNYLSEIELDDGRILHIKDAEARTAIDEATPLLQQIVQGVDDIKSGIGDVDAVIDEILNGPPTLIEKTVTANGVYNASDDDADGYSKVTVDVGGSVARKDVNFYDYDGTIVNSYTTAEFAELSAMPANPSHDGLTAQGWNWSLADAKTYVASYGKLNIGQMYVTSDDKTYLHIRLNKGRLKPYLGLTGNSNGTTVSIDWGDSSTAESVTLDTSTVYTPHEYITDGEYVISITVTSGTISLNGTSSSANILRKSSSAIAEFDKVYANILTNVELGTGVTSIGGYAFSNCYSLESITIPSTVTFKGPNIFYYCYSLVSVTIPSSVTSIGGGTFNGCSSLVSITIPSTVTVIDAYTFGDCRSLESITIPSTVTSLKLCAIHQCYSLAYITIPSSVTSIEMSAFYNSSSLTSVTIPSSVTSIGGYAFANAKGLGFIKFERMTPPNVDSANAWTNIPPDCIIYVPTGSLSAYTSKSTYPPSSTYTYVEY